LIWRQRQKPSSEIERSLPLVVQLAPARQEERSAIGQASDALGGTALGMQEHGSVC
jgi:hypothetical protein